MICPFSVLVNIFARISWHGVNKTNVLIYLILTLMCIGLLLSRYKALNAFFLND